MDLQTFYMTVAVIFWGAVGLCVGSFLNVVIYRLPNGMSLATPPSHCTVCGYQLRWFDNVPIFSYLFLGGKCRKCKSKISPRYLCVEIANMVLWLLCLRSFGLSGWRGITMTLSASFACSVCLCIAAIDLEHRIIYDRFQVMMLAAAVAFMIADGSVISNLIGAAVIFGVVLLVGLLVSRRAGREALGGGDIKFAFVSALLIGWKRAILMWMLASVSALIVILLRRGKEKDGEYPFAPFLVFGFVIALLFGMQIISAYFGLFGIEI